MKLIMLIGPSLCGKSTYSEKFKNKPDWVIVSSDATREELGFSTYDPQDNPKTFATVRQKIYKALDEKKNVVYDATNINKKLRKREIQNLKTAFPELQVHAVVFNVNPDMLYSRAKQREFSQINYITPENIEKQLERFKKDYPNKDEFDVFEEI